jgi:hypothetical protein
MRPRIHAEDLLAALTFVLALAVHAAGAVDGEAVPPAPGPMPGPAAFSEMDIDSDGYLSWAEARGLVKVRFSDADRDGDGRVSDAEFQALRARLHLDPGQPGASPP